MEIVMMKYKKVRGHTGKIIGKNPQWLKTEQMNSAGTHVQGMEHPVFHAVNEMGCSLKYYPNGFAMCW